MSAPGVEAACIKKPRAQIEHTQKLLKISFSNSCGLGISTSQDPGLIKMFKKSSAGSWDLASIKNQKMSGTLFHTRGHRSSAGLDRFVGFTKGGELTRNRRLELAVVFHFPFLLF